MFSFFFVSLEQACTITAQLVKPPTLSLLVGSAKRTVFLSILLVTSDHRHEEDCSIWLLQTSFAAVEVMVPLLFYERHLNQSGQHCTEGTLASIEAALSHDSIQQSYWVCNIG